MLGNDSDPDEGASFSITSVSDGNGGSVLANSDDTVTYTPDSGFLGTDTFTYTITDETGRSASATVTVLINQEPLGQDDADVVVEDGSVAIDVLAND